MGRARNILALFCLCFGAAMAVPDVGQIQAGYALIDVDQDQKITVEEWEQHAFALFRAADLNDNQVLEGTEIDFDADTENTFSRADANQDGQLSVDEYMNLRRSLFKVADINRGDFINFVEYTLFSLFEITGWKDRNHNNRINFSELRQSLIAVHQQADRDQDGELNRSEASFLSDADYQLATAEGPLTAEALNKLYRFHLTGS